MRMLLPWIVGAALLSAAAPSRAGGLQKGVPEIFPGKLMLGARPLGVQAGFVDSWNGRVGLYKFGLDFSGKVADLSKVTIWVGGEFNLGGRENIAEIELGVFCMITLEKLITKFPLVPIVSAGISAPIYVLYGLGGPFGTANDFTVGGMVFKVGGGAYYFLLKNLGVGADTHFGVGFLSGGPGAGTGFHGYWDLLMGIRAAF